VNPRKWPTRAVEGNLAAPRQEASQKTPQEAPPRSSEHAPRFVLQQQWRALAEVSRLISISDPFGSSERVFCFRLAHPRIAFRFRKLLLRADLLLRNSVNLDRTPAHAGFAGNSRSVREPHPAELPWQRVTIRPCAHRVLQHYLPI